MTIRFIAILFTAILFTQTLAGSIQLFSDDSNVFSKFQARELGPTVFGGRVVDIAVDPAATHRIFVASASGGLWLTENNGTSWKNIFENQGTISIGDIALDNKNTNVIWVGTGEANNQRSSLWGDGIYKTTDGGKTWNNMGLQDTQHIGRVLVDPENSDIVYVAAIGHLYTSNEERGLFKTTDSGKTWEKILYVNEDVGVIDVVIDPKNPNNLYAATYERLRRAWNFDGAGPGSAIYKSDDAGKSWKKLTKGLPNGEIGRIGLAIFPKDPKVLFAAVSNQNLAPTPTRSSRSASKAKTPKKQDDSESTPTIELPHGFKLKQTDQGFTIADLPSNHPARRSGLSNGQAVLKLGGIEATQAEKFVKSVKQLKKSDQVKIAVKSKDKILNIVLNAVSSSTPQRQIGGEVYKSVDAGETWKKVNSQPVGGSPAYYYGQIRVDPTDANRLYILSVPVYTSTDGGKSWTTTARSVHVDHHALWINPHKPNHIMLGNDGGFHQSYDYGKTMDHYLNIPMSQFYAITADMQDPYHVYGGTQDNGSWGGPSRSVSRFRRGVSALEWYRVGGGDGFYVQVDPNDSNFLIAESQFGAIFKANRATGLRKSIRPRPDTPGERYRFNWNSPILMSTHDSRVIYFGGNKLFKSMNQGDDWEAISDDLTTADVEKTTGNVPHCTITTIAESSKDKKLLMVGTDDGKVQVTKDGGQSWIDVSKNFPIRPREWWCSRVELSTHDTNTAYASFTGYREDDFRCFVFKTTDLGESWTSIAGDLPQESVNVIKEDRINSNLLFVGTELGCYATKNGGVNWSSIGKLPRVSVQDLLIHPRENDLILGTHGRGIFIVDDISPLQQLKPAKTEISLMQPREIKSYVAFSATPVPSLSGDRGFTAPNPTDAGRIWYHVNTKTTQKYKIEIVNKTGKSVFSMAAQAAPGLHAIKVRFGSSRRRSGRFGRSQSRGTPRPADVFQATAGTYRVKLVPEKDADQAQEVELTIK